jgi:uroporphyrin-3 C-methyltransferase
VEQAPAPEAAVKKATAEKAPAKSNTLLVIFSLLLTLIALVAVGGIAWKGYEFSQQLAEMNLQLKQSEDKNTQLGSQVSQLTKQSNQLDKQLSHNGERLAQLPGADRNDWLLAEAEYLLRLANQRLSLENDWQGTINILQSADKVLAGAENPLLLPVRQLIAQEVQNLKAVPAVDTTGAVARLQALQSQIEKLEWMPRTLPQVTAQAESQEEDVEQNAWDKFVEKAMAGIGVIVRIREHEEALPAPLTPDQHYYLQQNMQLMLEQAQVALVRQNDELYLQSIERTQAWLKEFVMIESADAKAAKSTLEELKTWNVSPELPEVSGSLNKLRQILDQQRRNSASPAQVSLN